MVESVLWGVLREEYAFLMIWSSPLGDMVMNAMLSCTVRSFPPPSGPMITLRPSFPLHAGQTQHASQLIVTESLYIADSS